MGGGEGGGAGIVVSAVVSVAGRSGGALPAGW